MKKLISFLLLLSFDLAIMAQTMPKDADPKLWKKALTIHRRAIVVDGHNDITGPMVDEDFDLSSNSIGRFQRGGDPFHTDLARLKAGGITGEFFSIYVSGSTLTTGGAMRRAMDMIDATYREAEKHPAQLSMCTTAADIRRLILFRWGFVCFRDRAIHLFHCRCYLENKRDCCAELY